MGRRCTLQTTCGDVRACARVSLGVTCQPHLGHWSLGVTLPARLSSGTSVGSPGLLLLRDALSRTCCSSTAGLADSGGVGFTGSSPGNGSSASSSGCSSPACFFFLFLALCWVRGNLMSNRNVVTSFKSSLKNQTDLDANPAPPQPAVSIQIAY